MASSVFGGQGVTGPSSAPNNNLAAFDGTSGQVIKDSGVAIPSTSAPLGLDKGGTGATLTDPNADRILFWDDSAGQVTWLTAGTGLTISGTTITAAGGIGGSTGSTDN